MKKFALVSVLFVLAVFVMNADPYQNVDAQTFAGLIEKEAGVLVDVRTPQEFSRGHIKGATLISMQDKQVTEKLNLLQKNKPIYLYCLSGSRSRVVANYLINNGFTQVYNLRKGIIEWQQLGYNLQAGTTPTKSDSKVYGDEEFGDLLKSSEIVLIDFHAPWCAPCKKMAPIVASIQSEFAGEALVSKLDIDANPTLRKAYGVESIPSFLLFKNGVEVWKHTGAISEQDLRNVLNTYLKK